MRNLGALSLLFGALIAVPAAILAWLGWQSTSAFEEQARTAVLRETLEVADGIAARVRVREAEVLARCESGLHRAAAVLAAQLPVERAGVALRRARAALDESAAWLAPNAVLRVRAADGRLLFPRPPGEPRLDRAAAWPELSEVLDEAARLEFTEGRGEEAARLLEAKADRLEADSLEALALAHATAVLARAGDARAADTAARLRALPSEAVVAAGPLAIECLLARPGGDRWIAAVAEAGLLEEVAVGATVRARWWVAGGRDAQPWQIAAGLLEEEGSTSFLVLRTPLRAGATAELALRLADLLPQVLAGERIGACDVTYALDEGSAAAGERGDDAVTRTLTALGAPVRAVVTHPMASELAREAGARRRITAIGIGALLLLMASGLLLVRRALARERAARRLRDDFIANVSHELKTPLTSLRMHAEMLAEDDLGAGTRHRYRDVVEAEGARLSALVEDLLDFAALERGTRRLEPEAVDLGRALDTAAAAWQPLARQRGVELTVERGAGDAAAFADTTALSRILANLVHNAFEHGHPPRNGHPARIRLVALGGPALEVRDNGPGVDPRERSRIFERFHRGNGTPRAGGAGIGLALSRDLARAMGGDLDVHDDGAETVFSLRLPELHPTPEETSR